MHLFQLSDRLPKKAPFICPDCHQEKNNEHLLILHYGVEHNISMELYRKRHDQNDKANKGISSSIIAYLIYGSNYSHSEKQKFERNVM